MLCIGYVVNCSCKHRSAQTGSSFSHGTTDEFADDVDVYDEKENAKSSRDSGTDEEEEG